MPSNRLPRLITLAALVLAVAASCSPARTQARQPDQVVWNPEPSVGPFVVVAVKNHFHDIHPYDQTAIAVDRPFIIKNQSYDLHNFTVLGTRISVDIRPLHQMVWPRLGDKLKPGQYTVVCKYHEWAGMTGTFIVTP